MDGLGVQTASGRRLLLTWTFSSEKQLLCRLSVLLLVLVDSLQGQRANGPLEPTLTSEALQHSVDAPPSVRWTMQVARRALCVLMRGDYIRKRR